MLSKIELEQKVREGRDLRRRAHCGNPRSQLSEDTCWLTERERKQERRRKQEETDRERKEAGGATDGASSLEHTEGQGDGRRC